MNTIHYFAFLLFFRLFSTESIFDDLIDKDSGMVQDKKLYSDGDVYIDRKYGRKLTENLTKKIHFKNKTDFSLVLGKVKNFGEVDFDELAKYHPVETKELQKEIKNLEKLMKSNQIDESHPEYKKTLKTLENLRAKSFYSKMKEFTKSNKNMPTRSSNAPGIDIPDFDKNGDIFASKTGHENIVTKVSENEASPNKKGASRDDDKEKENKKNGKSKVKSDKNRKNGKSKVKSDKNRKDVKSKVKSDKARKDDKGKAKSDKDRKDDKSKVKSDKDRKGHKKTSLTSKNDNSPTKSSNQNLKKHGKDNKPAANYFKIERLRQSKQSSAYAKNVSKLKRKYRRMANNLYKKEGNPKKEKSTKDFDEDEFVDLTENLMSLKKSKAGKEDKNQNKKNERIGEDSSDDEMYLGEKIAIVRQKAEYSAAEEAMGKPTERIAPAGENKKDSISPGEFSYVAYGGIAILGVILFAVTIAFFLKKNKRKSLNNDYLY